MEPHEVKEILENIKHPEIDATLVELGMIKDIRVEGKEVVLTMAFPFPGVPIREMLIDSVRRPLEEKGFKVKISETVMNPQELQRFFQMEQEKWKGF